MIEIDGQPWFMAADVCRTLGHSNTTEAITRHVDERNFRSLTKREVRSPDFPNRGASAVNEAGVYDLVFGSKLPAAKEFKAWVTRDVIPAMQRTPASSRCNFWGITSALVSRERERGVYLANH